MSRFEKKLKDELDDEIKLAGLEALVPAELEKHLILNSNRLRDIQGYAPGSRDVRGGEVRLVIPIPWMLMRSNLCHIVKEKGHRVHEMVVSSVVEHIFNVTAMHAKATASNQMAKANKASHGPRVRAKERVRE